MRQAFKGKVHCETHMTALKVKQEACQFGHFLQANPAEKWIVCSLPNLYF